MTTVQIVGIAVAAAIVLLLVLALLVTRRGGEHEEVDVEPPAEDTGSFLDAPVTDTLGKLGKAEHEPEDAAAPDLESPPLEATPPPGPGATGLGLGLDWGPGGEALEVAAAGEAAAAEPEPDDTETTGDLTLPAAADEAATAGEAADEAATASEAADEAATAGEAAAAEPEPDDTETTGDLRLPAEAEDGGAPGLAAAAGADAAAPVHGARTVPLSDIIVTTSDKFVDLDDPEVRRMLADLVTFEIDQAAQYRQQGQTIDAVLQLTEAEKICKALGMHDTALRIGRMMDDLKA